MEDFALGYEQTGKSEEIRFPAKTDAYRTWSEQLVAYAQSPEMEKERAYWQAVDQMEVPAVPKDMEADVTTQRGQRIAVCPFGSRRNGVATEAGSPCLQHRNE